MKFVEGNIYHIYNRGNNKQNIFFNEGNYLYFLRKMRKYIHPHCDLLAWVLMPNHFHLLIHADERTVQPKNDVPISGNPLSEGMRLMLSSYTKGINKQQGFSGNLIRQNTLSKCVFDKSEDTVNYVSTCFTYIHQNPIRAGFVSNMEDWEYSSYKDYAGLRNGTLCNRNLAEELIDRTVLHTKAETIVGENSLKNIW